MSIFNYKQRNNIVLGSIVVLGCFLLYALSGLISSILGAIVLYTIFRPAYIYLTERKSWNRSLVAIMVMITSLILIIIPLMTLCIMAVSKIGSIKTRSLNLQQWTDKIDDYAGYHFNQPHFAENTLQKLGSLATEIFPSILTSAASIIVTLLVMYFLLYFMLVQMREFEAAILKYAPFREQHALRFALALR